MIFLSVDPTISALGLVKFWHVGGYGNEYHNSRKLVVQLVVWYVVQLVVGYVFNARGIIP